VQEIGEPDDPVLQTFGAGRDLWTHEAGDRMVDGLRSEDSAPAPPVIGGDGIVKDLPSLVWHRIEKHQGEPFHTSTGLPVTFEVDGNGIWFFRDGRRIERKATRTQVEKAISRCPLKSTTGIRDLMDYAYLFAILTDRRIRGRVLINPAWQEFFGTPTFSFTFLKTMPSGRACSRP
jgi:hypothetical protein